MAHYHSRALPEDRIMVPSARTRSSLDGAGSNIFVRCPDGRTMCMTVNPSATKLEGIKLRVRNETGLHVNDQFLQWNAKPLGDDGMTLSQYGMRDGSTLHLSSRRRGGCFIVSFSILMVIIGAIFMSCFTCGFSLCIVPFLLPLLCILPLFCL